MTRQPFVWEVHVRREMVEDELARLRELPYGIWRETMGVPRVKTVTGRDSREYTMTVTSDWVRGGSDDIRVTVTLAPARRRRTLLEQSFVITPDNRFA
ncbi:MAG TPA: hypothetical protein VK886_04045 [Vicinamibacterales bacterium]|nr:hypothetical protein [Vicinamibacterales bacterium]